MISGVRGGVRLGDLVGGWYDICICMVSRVSREFLLYVRELARGLRREKCLSTHFSIASTESVDERRLSADVLVMLDDAMRNVAAIPLRAWNN